MICLSLSLYIYIYIYTYICFFQVENDTKFIKQTEDDLAEKKEASSCIKHGMIRGRLL